MAKHPALFVLVFVGLALTPLVGSAQQYVGAGAGIYTDDGDLDGLERRDVVRETDESFSFDSHNSITGSVWYLRHLSENVRWGGGIRYYGSYQVVEVPDDEDSDEEFLPYELGELTNLYLQAEYLIPFGGNKALIVGMQAGPSILMPDGEMQQTIDDLKDDGVDVWDAPRLGFNVAPQIGGRWEFDDRLSFRADLGVRYENLYLFAIDDNVEGVAYEKSWTSSALRYEFGLAMEIQL